MPKIYVSVTTGVNDDQISSQVGVLGAQSAICPGVFQVGYRDTVLGISNSVRSPLPHLVASVR